MTPIIFEMKLYPFSLLLAATAGLMIAPVQGAPNEDAALAVIAIGTEQRANAINELAMIGTAKSVPVLAGLLSDNELSDYARNALQQIPDPSAGQALMASLNKLQGKFLTGVVITLGDRREKAAVPALLKLAANPKCAANDAALSSLAMIASDEAAASIATIIAGGPAELKLAAVNAALRAAGRMPKGGAFRTLLLDSVLAADVPARLKTAAEVLKK